MNNDFVEKFDLFCGHNYNLNCNPVIGFWCSIECLRVFMSVQQDDKSGKEVILDDNECPLQIFRDWPADRGKTHRHMLMYSGMKTSFPCVGILLPPSDASP